MKFIENQKTVIMIVILVLSIVISTIVTESIQLVNISNNPTIGNDKVGIVEIDVDEYLALRELDNLNIIHIGSPNCSWSAKLEPYMREIAEEYDLTIYYINIDDFTEEEKETFDNSHELLKEGYGTPTLIIVGRGDIIEKQEGFTENKEAYIEFFGKHNLIK